MTNETENANNGCKKEKKTWYNSLTRRKKSQNPDLDNAIGASADRQITITSTRKECTTEDCTSSSNTVSTQERERKRRSFRHRLTKFMFAMSRSEKKESSKDSDHVADESEPQVKETKVMFNPKDLPQVPAFTFDTPEMISFSDKYRHYAIDKWLNNGHPNPVMANACLEMLSQVWYWGEISRDDAQRQLKEKDNGSFLVRDSESSGPASASACRFTLSFRNSNCTLHYRLEYHNNYWHFEALQYKSIVKMIEDILHRCMRDHFVCFVQVSDDIQPRLHVFLKHPVSRYSKIMKLEDLCRRVIKLNYSEDEIQAFDIPAKLKQHLGERCQLVFQSP